jgi:hypothetical protein
MRGSLVFSSLSTLYEYFAELRSVRLLCDWADQQRIEENRAIARSADMRMRPHVIADDAGNKSTTPKSWSSEAALPAYRRHCGLPSPRISRIGKYRPGCWSAASSGVHCAGFFLHGTQSRALRGRNGVVPIGNKAIFPWKLKSDDRNEIGICRSG